MDELQGARMALLEVDAGNAAVVNLTEELTEVGTTLVPHPRLRDEGRLIACLDDAIGEVDILAKAHLGEASQLLIDLTTDAHVIGAGEELVELLALAATNATRGKERGHRIRDGLLDRGERRMRGIGTTESGKTW